MRSKRNLNPLILFPCLFMVFACSQSPKQLLPIYGEKSVVKSDTVYHTISDFSLTNQYGETISRKIMLKKICVANFFFATCQSICPEMSNNLADVQKEFEKDSSILILSHSVNPLHDTVEVLKNYALTYGAKKDKWHLLTGDKKQIYDLAKNSYMVNALEDDGTPEGFLHSELFLLVDGQGRLRGMYDGTDKAEVKKLIAAIYLLKKEES